MFDADDSSMNGTYTTYVWFSRHQTLVIDTRLQCILKRRCHKLLFKNIQKNKSIQYGPEKQYSYKKECI